MAPESLPSAQTSPYKPHTQAFLMPHAYLKFSMPKHCCSCIFCPVGAISTVQSPVLEAWESWNHHCLPPHNTLCQFSLPNGSQIWVLISIYSPRLPLSLLSFAAQTIAEAPELVSAPGLFPSSHPPPICWHHQSRMQWSSITHGIAFIKENMSSKTRALPPSPFPALNTPSDLWLLPTPPEIEVANSCSSWQLCSGIAPPGAHIHIAITTLSRLYCSSRFFCISHQLSSLRASSVPMFSSSL